VPKRIWLTVWIPLMFGVLAVTDGQAQGSIVAWGWNNYGQCDVPSPNSGFVAASAGWFYSLGLKSDGSITAWGWNDYGQSDVPSPNSGFVAVSAGYAHSLGLKSEAQATQPSTWGSIKAQFK
jgi:alpha-tubulin suppressor-like RCC1 family protein